MISWLYQKIFIAIVYDGNAYDIRVVTQKQKKLINKQSKRYEGESALNDALSFVHKQIEESPLHYVALLNPSPHQGAFPKCFSQGEDNLLNGTTTLCRNEKWTLYTSERKLEELLKQYAPVGLDFLFSPFSIIERFFADKLTGGLALYAFALKDSFSIAFFEEGKLEFAHHYPMHQNSVSTIVEEGSPAGFSLGVDEEEKDEKGISLDDIESLDDLDIIDELDDLSDIEDLDALEEIVEFSDDAPTSIEKHASVPHADEVKGELDRFNDDYARFELIEKTLSDFYAGEYCKNRFVETVYIADAYGSGTELKRYLEEELFLNVLIRRIDTLDTVISLAIDEEEGL
ncbi:MAG: hypothetical protein PHQ90_00605 [Sulfuricurvum sp.]|uniref:hypothetical protein n=1 Tax=Sulfuricurvum sp. TaxID=2025608 RepID=UPI002614325F|nr:hypothetical protein [Sulfuricurvum sp.]MDD2367766.1 hypothetical protein [Sulfuricurvum sp.]MDD2949303.1 hypothetical protein [Sulfuricurvum sp.]MDD5118389.1 hypothetical protein [Sulfuricurvum sp.]